MVGFLPAHADGGETRTGRHAKQGGTAQRRVLGGAVDAPQSIAPGCHGASG